MRKYAGLVIFILAFMLAFPMLAHADDLNYDVSLNGFWWGTTVATPQYRASSSSYGGDLAVRFKKGSGMENWGFSAEYTNTPNGPRLVNTGGACVTTAGSFTGQPVPLPGGGCGLESRGSWQFGGGSLRYWFPTSIPNFNAAIYGDYWSITGGRNAFGGGAVLEWNPHKSFMLQGFADWNNVTGNSFPSQNLLRYQVKAGYMIPETSINVFVGYRGYNFTRFNKTYVDGVMAGLGTRW